MTPTSKFPSVVKPLGQLGQPKKSRMVEETPHSAYNQMRSEAYHARHIGQPRPNNQGGLGPNEVNRRGSKATAKIQEAMESPRPGLTMQRGLGG